ncbi:ABC transporter permease [Palaeococcus ferrophilus]|uniref:ABC transporter permease n=1 Tax=Palaeococcus ferrophilus TaxID=83868 RepID=UPI00064FD0BB|nr:ABC transporter permease [Palaeococcus ferrophilus]
MAPELNIALKEFYVAVRSKRFIGLLLFYVVLILLINYAARDELLNLAGSVSVEDFGMYGAEGTVALTPVSLSLIANLTILSVFGALIGISLGADTINREVEEGTIKVLLSRPVYRDQVINGKFIGNGLALALISMIGFVVSIAYLLIIGAPVDGPSIVRALLASLHTLLYMLTFLSLGVLLSTLIRKVETAILVAIILAIFLTTIYPVVVNVTADKIAGEMPYCPPRVERVETPTGPHEITVSSYDCPAMREWENKRKMWQRRLYLLMPGHHYAQLILSAFAGDEGLQDYLPIGEAFPLGFNSLAILLVELIFPFSVAYARFMTSDLRG